MGAPITHRPFDSLWLLLKSQWLEVGLSSLLINSGQILLPLFSMLVYDKIVSNGVFETLWALVIGMMIFIALDVGMRVTRNWTVERVAADMARKTDEGLWHKLLADRDMPAGGVATFLAHYRDLTNALNFVSSTYLLAIADLPFYLLYMLVIGFIAWPVMILVGVLTLLYAGIGYLLQLQTLRLNRETEHKSTQRMAYIGEVLQGMEIVRTVPGVTGLLQGWRTQSETVSELEAARRLSASHSNTLSAGMMTFTTVSVLALGAYLIEARTLSVGGLIACSLLAARAMMLVTSLYLVLGKWEDFTRSAKRMDGLLESGKEAQGISNEVEQSAPHASFAVSKPQAKGDITLLRLTKRYPDRPAALENVTLNIVSGEKIGLLGRPGAGKTTLLKAIAGLSIVDEGEVLIDGYELHAISPADRAKWMAYKPQDPVLFAGTLEANLLLAGVKPQSERMEQALWASGLDEELRQGRLTLTMAIADRGSNLSGGQRQKVALARAFAQQSSILLLDEPSLGLDPEGEQLLATRLPQLVGNGNLIMISHSAAMMSAVQRIVAMDGGKIVADGTKEKLLRPA
ncbi:ATP-binding cassette domain-containing protein [Methylobacillus gramineus]|uniref:peptidase domain-containing ABC transporter n=1 Tax=Methylobacillus gramineus TaxID=755169 RepID=UPI001CFFF415|nr:ATP-binding cassette domain-containing protein [Methylobacillus gramineus]MCB5185935.1 ATP-binding cassette domain-containing protein [Methylobacillus gramineus]